MTADEQIIEMRKTIRFIQDSHTNPVFELRCFKPDRFTMGFFDNEDDCIKQITAPSERGKTWYIAFNEIAPDTHTKKATKDGTRKELNKLYYSGSAVDKDDVTRRTWIFIDFDAHTNVTINGEDVHLNASQEEKQRAEQIMLYFKKLLHDNSIKNPVVATSGNGYHLLYRINEPNTTFTERIIKDFLQTLEDINPDSFIEIDTDVADAPRHCKLYGSKTKRGQDTAERPQRYSCLIDVPGTPQINKLNTLIKFISKHRKA